MYGDRGAARDSQTELRERPNRLRMARPAIERSMRRLFRS
jgi:hypothetical protein